MFRLPTLTLLLLLSFVAAAGSAAPAYNSGWVMGAMAAPASAHWSITTNNDNTSHFAGTFIADAGASGVNSGIDADGKAFGMYAKTCYASVSAMRDFTGGILLPGRSFSLQVGVNYRDGAKGVILLPTLRTPPRYSATETKGACASYLKVKGGAELPPSKMVATGATSGFTPELTLLGPQIGSGDFTAWNIG